MPMIRTVIQVFLLLLTSTYAMAGWFTYYGNLIPPDPYAATPQGACEWTCISRAGNSCPYRLAWLPESGQSGGFYRPGFDMSGPVIPNSENNYHHENGALMYCILDETYAVPLEYDPGPRTWWLGLFGATETRPAGTGGTSTITFTAKTTTPNGQPKAGVALNFSVDVKPNSGGHDHHSTARPKGTLSPTQGVTNANGELAITFTAPEFAGIHTIKATCPSCSNKEVSKEIQVKVPDLLPISPNPPTDADGAFVYALTSVDKTHQGNGRYHVNQYYLTEQSRQNLRSMIAAFSAEGWGTVALNDASLYWGGRYDIESTWGGSHKGHREGREIDISFSRARNPIPVSKQKVFYKKFCEDKAVQVPFSILHHYVENPHFHVYLERQTACWKSEK